MNENEPIDTSLVEEATTLTEDTTKDPIDSPEEGEYINKYIGSKRHLENIKAAQARSVESRKGSILLHATPKFMMNVELSKETAYTRSAQPIAVDDKGKQSVRAEVATYIGTREGVKLLRKAIRATVVRAAFGDMKALQMLYDLDPAITQVAVSGMVGHLVADANRAVISPAERRRLELSSGNAIQHEFIEAEQVEPVDDDN